MSPAVEQPVTARLITDAPHHKSVAATLRYDSDDPLAVRVVFPPEVSLDDDEVVWTFARDLLSGGLRAPSGDGDVRVWPCGRAQTVLELHAPEGVAVVQFDTAPLRRFLQAAYAAVPVGQEQEELEIERHIGNLLL